MPPSEAKPAPSPKAPRPTGRAGGYANLLRFLYDWKVRRAGDVRSLPLEVSLEITNVCNFKCAFCPQSSPDHFDFIERTYLDPEKAHQILTQVRELGYDKPLIHWTLDGEPFVSKAFADICEVGARLGFTNQYFASNLALATVDRIRALPSGVSYTLTVDYCADPATFEDHRGTPGSWQSVHDNIEGILADPSLGHVSLELNDMTSYKLSDPEQLRESMQSLRALFPDSPRIKFFGKTFHNAAGFGEPHAPAEKTYHLCPYPWSSLNIAANGDVVPCCRDLRHKTVLGNVFEEHLVDLWNGPNFNRLRQDLVAKRPDRQEACAGCDLPHDNSKFTLRNQLKTLLNRLQFRA